MYEAAAGSSEDCTHISKKVKKAKKDQKEDGEKSEKKRKKDKGCAGVVVVAAAAQCCSFCGGAVESAGSPYPLCDACPAKSVRDGQTCRLATSDAAD